jgi:Xaa-Pro aminopeptidase
VHDVGPNIDDLETQDRRKLQEGVAFTVEPGIYLPHLGIRSEINIIIQNGRAVVTTLPLQTEVTCLV